MKKVLGVLMIVLFLLLVGCSNSKDVKEKGTIFYLGQSKSWLATYSITKVKSIYYNSLCIQYLFDNNNDVKKIGPIEYQLINNSMKTQSSCPQELQGDAYFHTGNRMNADVFKITFDEKIKLTIKWQDKNETIKLERQN